MTTPTGPFANVEINIRFSDYPPDKRISQLFNETYRDTLTDIRQLFVDENNLETVKPDSDLLPKMQDLVVQDILIPSATQSNDFTVMNVLIKQATFKIHRGGNSRTVNRLTAQNLTNALKASVSGTNPTNCVDIVVGISHFHFDTANGMITFLDWSKISNQPFITPSTVGSPPPAPPAPLTAVDIASAVASSMPAPITAAQIASAVSSAVASTGLASSTSSGTSGSSGSTTSPTTSTIINHNALPVDVKLRYQNRIDGGLMLGSTVRSPYSSNSLYYHELTPSILILADGFVYSTQTLEEKSLFKASIQCQDDTFSGIRSWYENFRQTCMDYGLYIHGFWCFRPDHGGTRGFTAGSDANDDLPDRMVHSLPKMSMILYRLLFRKDMFPKDSNCPKIVQSCDGDGYRALKGIIFKTHPAFADQPSTFIKTYPRQRDLSMLAYYKLFTDFQQLKAWIADSNLTLDNQGELDIFINNAKYGTYLNRVTRDERRIKTLEHKYKGPQLVETLDKYLLASDSPANVPARSNEKPYKTSRQKTDPSKYRSTMAARVNQLGLANLINDDSSDDDSDAQSTATEHENDEEDDSTNVVAGLNNIKVPNDPRSREIYHVYCAAVNRIQASPQAATTPNCIICNERHAFDKCTVLKNVDFLRGHMIRSAQHLKREKAALERLSTGDDAPKTFKPKSKDATPIYFIDSKGHPVTDDDSDDDSQDFQPRRTRGTTLELPTGRLSSAVPSNIRSDDETVKVRNPRSDDDHPPYSEDEGRVETSTTSIAAEDSEATEDIRKPAVHVETVDEDDENMSLETVCNDCEDSVGEQFELDLNEDVDDSGRAPINAVNVPNPDLYTSCDVLAEPQDPGIKNIEDDDDEIVRVLFDTGAFATVTGQKHILHDYVPFTKKNKSPLKLEPATEDSDAVPIGYGYMHIPAPNAIGFISVLTFYSPVVRTTLLNELDALKAHGDKRKDFTSEYIAKYHDIGKCTYIAKHKRRSSRDVMFHGTLINGKCYTEPLILPFESKKIEGIARSDPSFITEVERATIMAVYAHQEREYSKLRDELSNVSDNYHGLPFHEYIQRNTPVNVIKKETERLLWHQRLGHPNDYYLYNAYKHVKGVPRFKHADLILDSCPTCIRAKQTKNAPGPNSTRKATRPFQGLSIDFSFAGVKSKDSSRAKEYVGFNGETCWILVSDHFSRMKFGDTRISKASPINWLSDFLKKHDPKCDGKYVYLDQGGELYKNPQVVALFKKFHYDVLPTGADASRQNGPVERGHLAVANGVRSLLTGANMDVRFWPYAFHHWLRIDNSIPSRDQKAAPLKIAQDIVDDFSAFRTFGCRVWVRPPGRRGAKFRPNSKKGIFLGFLPKTTRNILWYDPETSRVKIATHVRFDEGMNDLPIGSIPPNVVHLQRTQQGAPIPAESADVSVSEFQVGSSPFFETISKTVDVTCRGATFGAKIGSDELNNRAFVEEIRSKSSMSRLFSTHKATNNKIRGSYITKINGEPVFTRDDVLVTFKRLFDSGAKTFDIEFAPERRLSAKQLRKAVQEHDLFNPHEPVDIDYTHALSIADIRTIATALYGDAVDFSEDEYPTEMVSVCLNAIRSTATTEAEQSIGHFIRRKLKKLDTWSEWEAGERQQLNRFHDLRMYGAPVVRPKGAIVLRPHWQYHIKRDGTRRARNCCDGSPKSSPTLHKFAQTYSSCVEQPVQRLFYALSAHLGYRTYGGDAKDAYAHSPPPERPTFVVIDDAYADWYKWKYGKEVDRSMVLPVQHALQGHPESGRLWESHINSILTKLGFQSTTHDKSIYRADWNGQCVLLLRQVDDFALSAPSEDIAKDIYDLIGKALQLPTEDEVPFTYLGLLDDYNGVTVQQFADRTVLNASTYIDRVMRTHGWSADESSPPTDPTVKCSPLPADAIPQLYSQEGPPEGSDEHQELVSKFGFGYRTLLGELLYAYVTCRPDIGYAIITLSKFASKPSAFHFAMLKKVAKYLRRTKDWGIHFRRSVLDPGLPIYTGDSVDLDTSLPNFPESEPGASPTCFLDAAHGNDLRQRRSTTGYTFQICGGAVLYKCKTQTTTATSSTEAEFYAAVSAAKHARYLRAILSELGFPPTGPTPLYCDNQSAIKMINAKIPTERSRHILIQFFAIQDWKATGDIVMRHIPGVINPSDDLTKPLGWVLHSRHARRIMGHY